MGILPEIFTKHKDKIRFLMLNFLYGWIMLAVLIAAYIILNRSFDLQEHLGRYDDMGGVIYTIFSVSELFFGIFPPEIFIVWMTGNYSPSQFIGGLTLLAGISYGAGVVGYWVGYLFHAYPEYRLMRRRFFPKIEGYLNRYGWFLLIVASLTPVPFSAVCMLLGSTDFGLKRFLLISLCRFLRFYGYGYIIYAYISTL